MASVAPSSPALTDDEHDVIVAIVDAAPPLTDRIASQLSAILRGVAS